MSLKEWATATFVKAVKTSAQTAVALLGVDQAGWIHADLVTVLETAGFAGVVCILHNIAGGESAPITVTTIIPSAVTPVVSDLSDPLAVGEVPPAHEDTVAEETLDPAPAP